MIARALTVLLCAGLLAVAFAAPASAVPLLDEGDAAELAQSLADATEEQGVCYGWNVQVSDSSGGPSGFDTGSNLGPGRPVGASVAEPCTRSVILEASVVYTCSSCESEDSSSAAVVSNFPGGPTTKDLDALGLKGGDLKGDDGDVTLTNMVGALPLLVAGKGLADPVPVEPSTLTPGATDKPTNTPSIPDWLRDSWLPLTALLVLILGGAVWLIQVLAQDRSRDARARRAEGRRFSSGGPPITPPDPTP